MDPSDWHELDEALVSHFGGPPPNAGLSQQKRRDERSRKKEGKK
ncbi:hypothetical protein BFJ66_g14532 [Fusarium oxysporum f. sp. cepae]|uniref:Uncharacterized protein n=1 Tax=Fusarium oxysporum f. sp. cepae TaxID=396571 RepID=A0A3L6NQ80_FUSOX|nr:hypothetical protein BFJ65_g6937 [Fusarium oxysporum f. sp. cepae]RKK34210.1 hypothetical protein BFJ66_g14532 [Fusarium oxysporum f. sp. cepae]RKK36958.1 hypothetical protein BFJ67_g12558 [Fusarium oxysporum f. sp. cepae]